MKFRLPSGTRDVLPEEMAERRRIEDALLQTFAEAGYGEVSTPELEYPETAELGRMAAPYRVIGEGGEELSMRADMTGPIARLVVTRYADESPPLRFCFSTVVHRAVQPGKGEARELRQSGIELLGVPGPEGTVEAISVLCRALEATGLADFSVGVGDISLYPGLLDDLGVPAEDQAFLLDALESRDFVAIGERARGLGLGAESERLVAEVPAMRGDAAVLEAEGPLGERLSGLRDLVSRLDPDVARRVIIDLGRFPRMGYYTGAVFEVYDPALGEPIGSGGRYDELLARFGRPLEAVGFAIDVDRLHAAIAGEELGETGR